MYFIPNEGQVDERALFYAKTSRYTLWLTKKGLAFDSTRRTKKENTNSKRLSPEDINNHEDYKYDRDVSRLIFVNANRNPAIIHEDVTEHKVNYFIGKNKSKWRTNIQTSRAVLYRELYPNIDLKVYGVEQQIEYDFVVKPGGEVSDICFEYKDTEKTRIDKEGNLVVETKFGELEHAKPECYQVIEGKRVKVEVEFKKTDNNTYGFKVEDYNKNYELIIDPVVLVYSTYLGGLGGEKGCGIAVNSEGAAYVTGDTGSTDFPTRNPIQGSYGGAYDVFIAKINSSGSAFIYSTYLGGYGGDRGSGIAVDLEGAAYVTGWTNSIDFPTQNPIQGTNAGHEDAFIAKINSSGGTLAYSTYLGGSDGEEGKGIAVDSEGAAYVTGITSSTDFPIQNPLQGTNAGSGDVFITKIESSERIRILSWNILDYPDSNEEPREEYFRSILEILNPDILVVQEMASAGGVDQFLKKVLNPKKPNLYKAASFYDGPDTDNTLFYKKAMFKIVSRQQIPTSFRDATEYKVRIKKGAAKGTTFKIYSVHFSEDAGAKKKRENEALTLRTYLDGLLPDDIFLVCGSFNMLSSTEKAFKILTGNQVNNNGRLLDPIHKTGKWHDKSKHKRIHTESTRKSKFGGGTAGGLDDRYDMILISYGLEENEKLIYSEGSCSIFGNDGKHLNKAINKPKNKIVSSEIADALYKASDHLPVIIDLVPQDESK